MKVRIEYITEGEEEVIIRCKDKNSEIDKVIDFVENSKPKIRGMINGRNYLLDPSEVYYCESTDNVVYIYTKSEVYKSGYILNELEHTYENQGFFRCSKSMVLNINAIKSLRSELGNKINATLVNGEHVIISRKYSIILRKILKS